MGMKKQICHFFMAAVLAGLLAFSVFAVVEFPDVEANAIYTDAVIYVNQAGIMKGDNLGNFNPDKTVTRAEMAAIICRMLKVEQNLTKTSEFTDVSENHWANAYIGKAVELGIVNGYGNGKFGPEDDVTYEQAVAMIVRALGGEEEAQDMGGYPNGYFSLANENDLLLNISTNPKDVLSRANIAIIIYNCIG